MPLPPNTFRCDKCRKPTKTEKLKRHPGSVIGLDFPPVVFLCPDCVPKSGSILDGIPVSPEVRVMLRKYGLLEE